MRNPSISIQPLYVALLIGLCASSMDAGPRSETPNPSDQMALGQWTTYDRIDGRQGLAVSAFLHDQFGRLWFATEDGGVSCLDGQQWRTYGRAHGLSSEDVERTVSSRMRHLA